MHGGSRDRVRAGRVHRVRLLQGLHARQGRQGDDDQVCHHDWTGCWRVLQRARLLDSADHRHRDENAAGMRRPEKGETWSIESESEEKAWLRYKLELGPRQR